MASQEVEGLTVSGFLVFRGLRVCYLGFRIQDLVFRV